MSVVGRNVTRRVYQRAQQGKWSKRRPLFTAIPKRHQIPLSKCENEDDALWKSGAILLGFSRNGEYLVGYKTVQNDRMYKSVVLFWTTFGWGTRPCRVVAQLVFPGTAMEESLFPFHVYVEESEDGDIVLVQLSVVQSDVVHNTVVVCASPLLAHSRPCCAYCMKFTGMSGHGRSAMLVGSRWIIVNTGSSIRIMEIQDLHSDEHVFHIFKDSSLSIYRPFLWCGWHGHSSSNAKHCSVKSLSEWDAECHIPRFVEEYVVNYELDVCFVGEENLLLGLVVVHVHTLCRVVIQLNVLTRKWVVLQMSRLNMVHCSVTQYVQASRRFLEEITWRWNTTQGRMWNSLSVTAGVSKTYLFHPLCPVAIVLR